MQDTQKFTVVKETNAKSKNGLNEMHIETSIKGLIYRCEAYMDSHLVDAEEVNCSDISAVDRYEDIFEARYKVTHRKFVELYTKTKIYSKVLNVEGQYSDGEGDCRVTTSISDNTILCEAFLDNNKIDQIEEEVDKAQAQDKKVFKAKYTKAHKDFVSRYIEILKFPANTFLNPILKKLPMYKKSPMYALGFLIAIIVIVLWIISIIVCGKAMKKLVAGVAGKEAGMVVKDLQKSMCKKKKGGDGDEGGDDTGLAKDSNGNLINKDGIVVSDFIVLPQKINFKDVSQVYPIYIKNNLLEDSLVTLKNRIILDFDDALVSPDMVVNILTEHALHVKAGEVGMFEFKLENEFLKSATLEERSYHGMIILEATNIQTKVVQNITIDFDFIVEKLEEQ